MNCSAPEHRVCAVRWSCGESRSFGWHPVCDATTSMSYQPPNPRSGVGTPRILLVDDEALVLAALGRSLGRKTSLRTAQSAKVAFEILGREAFDAIVSDYLMPDVDGLALLTLVR